MRIPHLATLVSLVLLFLLHPAPASVSISFSAGIIRGFNGLPVDLNSIGVLVADTGKNGFGASTALQGSTLLSNRTLGGSDNIILQTFSAEDLGDGVIGFNGPVNISDTKLIAPGTPLALYWFSTVKTVGATIPTNTSIPYGFYRTDLIDTTSGSDIGFTAPPDGYSSTLAVFDNSTFAGTLASAANLTASSSTGLSCVPETSSAIQAAVVFLILTAHITVRHLRQRKRSLSSVAK